MTLQLKKSGSYTYLYAIKSFRKEDGRCTTKVVEKFGTVEELREKLGGEDPIEWARARVAEMTAAEKEESQNVAWNITRGVHTEGRTAQLQRRLPVPAEDIL